MDVSWLLSRSLRNELLLGERLDERLVSEGMRDTDNGLGLSFLKVKKRINKEMFLVFIGFFKK